jgi:dihydroorotate dehydrogenase (fumarate)
MTDATTNTETEAVEMATHYLGLPIQSPIVASASPITGNPRHWNSLEQAGAGAIVLPSLFEEQIEREAFALDAELELGADLSAESASFMPELDVYNSGPDRHLALVELARERLTIPVIASLNGTTPGGWVQYAKYLEQAGAQAIELNLYDVIVDVRRSAHDVEQRYLELVQEVCAQVTVPLAVKLGPWFTSRSSWSTSVSMGWCCSIGSTNPTSTSRHSTSPRGCSCRPRSSRVFPSTGSGSCAARPPVRWPARPACTMAPTR